ncbi:MAG: dCTP deaminase [Pseudomonadota bacterium]
MILARQDIIARRPIVDMAEDAFVAHGRTGGLSACGYDLTLGEPVVLWPNKFVLSVAAEQFDMPDDLMGLVTSKSSLARDGVWMPMTTIEPGWRGFLTLEITNHADEVKRFPQGYPIAQVLFMALTQPTDRPYAGRYQDQPARPVPAIDAGDE